MSVEKTLTAHLITKAFHSLADLLMGHEGATLPITLIMGGGGAMILAHRFPLATTNVDAVARGIEFSALDPLVKSVAKELGIPSDWLNPYYGTFSHVLPSDYDVHLVTVFDHPALRVDALGKDEMLIMKCFAHRRKDVGHARALVRANANIARVEGRIEELLQKKIPHAEAALDFLQGGHGTGRKVSLKVSAPFSAPSIYDLKKAYDRFVAGKDLDAEFFASVSQWTRFDPRLGEIWCSSFLKSHPNIDLREFRTQVRLLSFPQVVGVLLAQIRGPEIRSIERYVVGGIKPVPYQDYFIAVSGFASKSVRASAESPLRSFRRYGFFGREIFRNKAAAGAIAETVTEIPKAARIEMLDKWLSRREGRFTVDDYLAALPVGVSRRVAQLDLRRRTDLEVRGSTRNRFYRRKRA